jgi:hypothetical protein
MSKKRRNRRRRRDAARTPSSVVTTNAERRKAPTPPAPASPEHADATLKCAACFPHDKPGRPVPLCHGVTLILCNQHRDPQYLASSAGRQSLETLRDLYTSLGVTARRFAKALTALIQLCSEPRTSTRRRPGSYAYPKRRRAAERVWAEGGSFQDGLAVAMRNGPPDEYDVNMPSRRTVSRWLADMRYLLLDWDGLPSAA